MEERLKNVEIRTEEHEKKQNLLDHKVADLDKKQFSDERLFAEQISSLRKSVDKNEQEINFLKKNQTVISEANIIKTEKMVSNAETSLKKSIKDLEESFEKILDKNRTQFIWAIGILTTLILLILKTQIK